MVYGEQSRALSIRSAVAPIGESGWGQGRGKTPVAAYDSSYNQYQDGLYNEMNSWVVVRTM